MLAKLGSVWFRKANVADLLRASLQELCSCQGQSRPELCVRSCVCPCQNSALAADCAPAALACRCACMVCRQSHSICLCAQLASAQLTRHSSLLVHAVAQVLKYSSQRTYGCVQYAAQGSKLCLAQGAALTVLFGVKTSHSCSCAASRAVSASRPWQWFSYKKLFSKENCKHVGVCQ